MIILLEKMLVCKISTECMIINKVLFEKILGFMKTAEWIKFDKTYTYISFKVLTFQNAFNEEKRLC